MKFFENTIEQVKLLAKQGKSRKEISQELKMSIVTLYQILRENPGIEVVKVKVGRKQKF